MPKINIGVTTYNGAERLAWLLRSIAMRTPDLKSGEATITIVDDGSPNSSATRAVAESFPELPISYIEHGSNRGISAGWNTASRAVDSPVNILLNDDVIVSADWLAPLVYVLEHSPDVGVVGQNWHAFLPEDVPGLLAGPTSDVDVVPRDPVSKVQEPDRRIKFEDTWPGRVMAPTGQLFAFRREDFEAIGGFDETYKSFFEEIDFGTAMAAKLKKIGVQTSWPFNYHLWSATFGQNPELRAGERMETSRDHYRRKWSVPDQFGRGSEFDHTNPTHLGTVGDVEIGFLRKDGPWRGVLRQDGSFVNGEKI
jgi:GT2 family glycosyltransferase